MSYLLISEEDRTSGTYSSDYIKYIIEYCKTRIRKNTLEGKILDSFNLAQELSKFIEDMHRGIENCIESFQDAEDIGLERNEQIQIISSDNSSLEHTYFEIRPESIHESYRTIIHNKRRIGKIIDDISKDFKKIYGTIKVNKVMDDEIDPTSEYFTKSGVFLIDYGPKRTLQRFYAEYNEKTDKFELYFSGERENWYTRFDPNEQEKDFERFTNILIISPVMKSFISDEESILHFAAKKYLQYLVDSKKRGFKVKPD